MKKMKWLMVVAILQLVCSCHNQTNQIEEKKTLLHSTKDSVSYYCGYKSADILLKQMAFYPDTMTLKSQIIIKGFIDALTTDSFFMSRDDAEMMLNGLHEFLNKQKNKDYIAVGDSLLNEYSKNDSVIKMNNGVLYKIISKGSGLIPTTESEVLIKYVGKEYNGKKFDGTPKEEPTWIKVELFNDCFTQLIITMPIGSKWQMVIPPTLFNTLSFGENSKVKPYTTLVYDFEMTDIKK